MLFLHEVHQVVGTQEDEFEAAFREGWMPSLAKGEDARLLWYTNHAHGSGVAYNVVTITAVRDGASWERLARRIQNGDLQEWMRALDECRHDVHAKILVPLPWSPLQEVDLASVPADGAEHELTMYMEDTMWPIEGKYPAYVEQSGSFYAKTLVDNRGSANPQFLEIQAAFQPAFGSHVRREVMLMQRILDQDRLLGLLTRDIPAEMRAPGTWMHDALRLRDQWESKLLRTASWSPRY
ncbi:MAG TPA: hypothetical protein VEP49_12205 [Acidimicrobiia bacterium]|nr:hypothetical protein [Acidimicrobiia bacterium]